MPRTATKPRPIAPFHRPDWDDLNSADRCALNRVYEKELHHWWIEGCDLVVLDAYQEGAEQACPECIAGSCGATLLARGTDSYGDCAEDGERVYWVIER